jgi:hypothetical protein
MQQRIDERKRMMRFAWILIFAGLLSFGASAADVPVIFWVSDPVQPDETLMISGDFFTPQSVVELARVDDASGQPNAPWISAPVLQVTAQSLKCVVPATFKPGIFNFRVRNGDVESKVQKINEPKPWWVQGDDGNSATPGGWVRVCGNCLNFGVKSSIALKLDDTLMIDATANDGFSLTAALPATVPPGDYSILVHNGYGASTSWVDAGKLQVHAVEKWPDTVFNVMDFYGKEKEKEMQKAIRRGSNAPDRTEAVQAAVKKAQEAGGGVIYFPAGTYGIQSELKIPPRTVLKGEGMGLARLWWGKGTFALDGGGSQVRKEGPVEGYTARMISGERFHIEDLTLYVPLVCDNAIQVGKDFRMTRVRVRVDKYWMRSPQRQNGTFLRVGSNFQVTDCDILAKASAIALGSYGVVARNKIQAGKSNVDMGGSRQNIIEDNQFVSLDPTAYINLAGEGRNLYYARNKHESLYVDQSDFSFTFDGNGAGYLGKVKACDGVNVTLAEDPKYLKWAPEKHEFWRRSVICIVTGRGTGQYRYVTANAGRDWKIDRPFDVAPDENSVITIAPYRGQLIVSGCRFEDANWVNMGYGSSFDVLCVNNVLHRCSQLLNYGLNLPDGQQPSWRVQYLNNEIHEGFTTVDIMSPHKPELFDGSVTRYVVNRGTHIFPDNSGGIKIGGVATDVIVEHCKLDHPSPSIASDKDTIGVLFRDNIFSGTTPRYTGTAAQIISTSKP